MRDRPRPIPLHEHIHRGPENGDEVKGEIEQGSGEGIAGVEFSDWAVEDLPQSLQPLPRRRGGRGGRFNDAALGKQALAAALQQRAVEGVEQGVAEEERSRKEGGDGRALGEDEESSGERGEGAVGEG